MMCENFKHKMEITNPDKAFKFIQRCSVLTRSTFFYNKKKTIKYQCCVYERSNKDGLIGYNVVLDVVPSSSLIRSILKNENDMCRNVDTDSEDDDDDECMQCVLRMQRHFIVDKEPRGVAFLNFIKEYNLSINRKICECEKYFIDDGADICVWCELRDDSSKSIECSLCGNMCEIEKMIALQCCKQQIHSDCVKKLSTCPFCRATL